MKVANYLALDPEYHGVGLNNPSKLDQQVWDEFAGNLESLHREAERIRNQYRQTSSTIEQSKHVESSAADAAQNPSQKRAIMNSSKYIYRPIATYAKLKEAEKSIVNVETIDELAEAMRIHGPRVGYKAFCYMVMKKMTPEAMKPEEASNEAEELMKCGEAAEAYEIFEKIRVWHPNFRTPQLPLPYKDSDLPEDNSLPSWLDEIL